MTSAPPFLSLHSCVQGTSRLSPGLCCPATSDCRRRRDPRTYQRMTHKELVSRKDFIEESDASAGGRRQLSYRATPDVPGSTTRPTRVPLRQRPAETVVHTTLAVHLQVHRLVPMPVQDRRGLTTDSCRSMRCPSAPRASPISAGGTCGEGEASRYDVSLTGARLVSADIPRHAGAHDRDADDQKREFPIEERYHQSDRPT